MQELRQLIFFILAYNLVVGAAMEMYLPFQKKMVRKLLGCFKGAAQRKVRIAWPCSGLLAPPRCCCTATAAPPPRRRLVYRCVRRCAHRLLLTLRRRVGGASWRRR